MRLSGPFILLALALPLGAAACSDTGEGESAPTTAPATADTAADAAAGIRVVDPAIGAELASADADVIVLDVRTPEEFAEGHIEGAELIDFYEADFTDRIAALDPDASYVLYCRSGNRSGQTRELMDQLGFTNVADVDGGILAWTAAGLPVTTG